MSERERERERAVASMHLRSWTRPKSRWCLFRPAQRTRTHGQVSRGQVQEKHGSRGAGVRVRSTHHNGSRPPFCLFLPRLYACSHYWALAFRIWPTAPASETQCWRCGVPWHRPPGSMAPGNLASGDPKAFPGSRGSPTAGTAIPHIEARGQCMDTPHRQALGARSRAQHGTERGGHPATHRVTADGMQRHPL